MTGLDDRGTIALPLCPLCEAWAVTVDLDDVPWPLAGLLAEQAVADHVDEHLRLSPCCACCSAADERGELDHEVGTRCPYPTCDYCQPDRMRGVVMGAILGPNGLDALG